MKKLLITLVAGAMLTFSAKAQLVSFVPALPEGWVKAAEGPISDSKGPIGNFIAYQNASKKLAIVIQISELSEKDLRPGVEQVGTDWKNGALDAVRNQGGEPTEIDFHFLTKEVPAEAELSFEAPSKTKTLYYFSRCRIMKSKLVSIAVVGQDVKIKEDEQVKGLIKSVVVK